MPLDFRTIQAVIADMDGVLWRDHDTLPGASEFFQALHGRIPYAFATNNSSKTVAYYQQKLAGMGISVQPDQIITSAVATAEYLAAHHPAPRQIFAIGEVGLKTALQRRGFILVEGFQNRPDIIVVGLDRQFSYAKLDQAIRYIRAGALFLATNADKTFPSAAGLAPGAGSLVAAVEAGSGVAPIVIGKPAAPMFQAALARVGSPPAHTLMIGDRLDTDIEGAARLGMKTALMLTGVAAETDIINNNAIPDAVYQNLAALLRAYRA
jgi:4-nitrophenyl phosphatase